MNGFVPRDVVRLILRFVATPVAARGLLGANRFWRAAVGAYYEKVARTRLSNMWCIPVGYTPRVVREQLTKAGAADVVALDALWYVHESINNDVIGLGHIYQQRSRLVNEAEAKVKARQEQVMQKRWGVKRTGSKKRVVESDEEWTRRMLLKAERQCAKVKTTVDVTTVHAEWKAQSAQQDRLKAVIDWYYEPDGPIGCHEPAEEPWRWLAQYPQLARAAKRKVEEASTAHERAMAEERELTAKLHKTCMFKGREEWPKVY